jgi:nicotinate-nucleotide adenylyltransferase
VTSAPIRCEMLEAAVRSLPHFGVDRRELERDGPTYTWDTVQSFVDDEPVLVLGADAAAGLRSWYRGDELIETVEIAVVARPGTTRDAVERAAPTVRWLEMPALDISSKELRDWIGRGFSARFLIPDAVLDVIGAHGLYSAPRDRSGR